MWEERREREGRDTLLDRSLLRIAPLRAGLTTLMMQQLILLGTFFVLPVYLQVVLGLDAFETGKRLFPMSVTMFVAAMLGPKLAAGFAPKRVAQAGLLALVARVGPPARDDRRRAQRDRLRDRPRLFGVGAGLLLSQLGNVIMSSVDPAKTNEAGGLQGTAQNLGASLGTALIGSVLILSLTNGFVDESSRTRRSRRRCASRSAELAQKGIPVVPVEDVERAALDQGVPPTRRRHSPTTTARRSSTGSSAPSARSRSSPCSPSGSPAGFRDAPCSSMNGLIRPDASARRSLRDIRSHARRRRPPAR